MLRIARVPWLVQLVGALSRILKVAGLIPGQSTFLGRGFDSLLGQLMFSSCIDVSFSLKSHKNIFLDLKRKNCQSNNKKQTDICWFY